MGRERLEEEFGLYSQWLVDAIEELGLADPIPPACRGTGNPRLFEHMVRALRIGPDSNVLDVGCGLGGPGEWLRRTCLCRVVGVDVMEEEVRGLHRLFPDITAVVANSRSLPFMDGAFDAGWALGVLELLKDKLGMLKELVRVLRPGARIGVYTLVLTGPVLPDPPAADYFGSADDLIAVIADAGLSVCEASAAPFPPPPDGWVDSSIAVRERVRSSHPGEPLLASVQAETAKIRACLQSGDLQPWQFILEKED